MNTAATSAPVQKPRLTEADFVRAAKALGVDVASIKAVTDIEAPGGGFLPSGEPKILFERHVFRRYTGGRYDRAYPDISHQTPGGYGASERQHARLDRAAKLDREAALKSASWGRFQIMGGNHVAAGHPTLQSFINAMYAGEGQHLDAFVQFVRNDRSRYLIEGPYYGMTMHQALQQRVWAVFARLYNGPDYAKNRYDVRLAEAYERHNRGGIG